MGWLVKAAVIVSMTGSFGTGAFAEPPRNLDARVEEIRLAAGVPGMAVVVVENGKVTHARGYGERRLGKGEPVDADTLFQLGSVTKAFTTAALAVLVDQGRIDWNDRVIDHMPWFQMYDPWVTREMTIVDLLVHRSGLGLGAGDLLSIPRSSLSRAETVRRLRYIKPATSFRSAFGYSNLLYAAAGQLIEEVTGRTWEEFVHDQVLRPAGMNTATSDSKGRRRAENRAWPHVRLNGPMFGMGDQQMLDDSGKGEFDPELGSNGAPAGSVSASAKDMGRWIAIQLAHGVLPDGGGRLFSEAAAREMWTPRTLEPIEPTPEPAAAATPRFLSYALGWTETDYRGHRLLRHSGAVFGAHAVIMLLPERNVGFAMMINSDDGEASVGLAFELLDHYLDRPYFDWGSAWREVVRRRKEEAVAKLKKEAASPAPVGPSLPLDRYAGKYADAWYGSISIAQTGGALTMNFEQTPGMIGTLTHWQYDTFRVDWRDPLIEPAYVTFMLDADGTVERIGMRAVSPLADFSFDYQDLELRPVAQGEKHARE